MRRRAIARHFEEEISDEELAGSEAEDLFLDAEAVAHLEVAKLKLTRSKKETP
jgi:hypothetical protein